MVVVVVGVRGASESPLASGRMDGAEEFYCFNSAVLMAKGEERVTSECQKSKCVSSRPERHANANNQIYYEEVFFFGGIYGNFNYI